MSCFAARAAVATGLADSRLDPLIFQPSTSVPYNSRGALASPQPPLDQIVGELAETLLSCLAAGFPCAKAAEFNLTQIAVAYSLNGLHLLSGLTCTASVA